MSNALARYLAEPVRSDLKQKMVFVGGPRQVGSARLDHCAEAAIPCKDAITTTAFIRSPWANSATHRPTDDLKTLLEFGGFPEPLLAGNARTWRRWQRERLSRVVYDDLRDLENVREVALVELLAEALPERVGSPLSVQSLAEDLQVAHGTVTRWLTILDNLYVCFRILPFGAPRIRAVKKEAKLYLWDWQAR